MRFGLVLVMLGLLATPALGDGWAGVCVASQAKGKKCLRVEAADAAAIQKAMRRWLASRMKAQRELARAHELAGQPITERRIGGYHVVTVRVEADGSDTLLLTASDWSNDQAFSAAIQPTKLGWKVQSISQFTRRRLR